jgi:excisionase family DNA binding protein
MPWDGAIRTRRKRRAWFKPGEVAAVIGVSAKTVRTWAASGKLAAERTPSGQYRFAARDIMRWISKRAAV